VLAWQGEKIWVSRCRSGAHRLRIAGLCDAVTIAQVRGHCILTNSVHNLAMDEELQTILVPLVQAFRIQQEHLLKLEAAVKVLQMVLARATQSDPQALVQTLSSIEDQIRNAEPTRAAREQVDAIIRLLESRSKDPDA